MTATAEIGQDSLRDVFASKHPTVTDTLWSVLVTLLEDGAVRDVTGELEKLSAAEQADLKRAAAALRRSLLWSTGMLIDQLADMSVRKEVMKTRNLRSMNEVLQHFVSAVVAEDFVAETADWRIEDVVYFDTQLSGSPQMHMSAFHVAAAGSSTVGGYTLNQFLARIRTLRAQRNIREAS